MTGQDITGVIMASGEGSRMRFLRYATGLPKHLLPIGATTIVTRIAQEMAAVCNEVVCVTPQEFQEHFEQEFERNGLKVKVTAKTVKGFKGDYLAAYENASYRHVILTVGDLIFPDGEIKRFISTALSSPSKLVLAFDRKQLRTFKFPTIVDFRMVLAILPKAMLEAIVDVNPESFRSAFLSAARFAIKKQLRFTLVDTLFNVNNPTAYFMAKRYFETLKAKA
jgi:CTP:molybdopterin cytidylyltransferase MocA